MLRLELFELALPPPPVHTPIEADTVGSDDLPRQQLGALAIVELARLGLGDKLSSHIEIVVPSLQQE